MQFKTLENISVAELLHVFNEAFSDYILPMHLTKEQLVNKIIAERIKKEISVGAFEGEKLIGFILHGLDTIDGKKIAYNAGTGVIPNKRGKKLTSQLYEFVLPKLKQENIAHIDLEVITNNAAAIKTYSSIGFNIKRTLNSYKGSLSTGNSNSNAEVKYIYRPEWDLLQSFWDWSPSWQNSIQAINNSWSQLDTIGLFVDENLVGYMVFHPKTNRILQFAIAKSARKKGLGNQLLNYFALNKSKTVSLTNIDDQSQETNNFLSAAGLDLFIRQYEMEFSL